MDQWQTMAECKAATLKRPLDLEAHSSPYLGQTGACSLPNTPSMPLLALSQYGTCRPTQPQAEQQEVVHDQKSPTTVVEAHMTSQLRHMMAFIKMSVAHIT